MNANKNIVAKPQLMPQAALIWQIQAHGSGSSRHLRSSTSPAGTSTTSSVSPTLALMSPIATSAHAWKCSCAPQPKEWFREAFKIQLVTWKSIPG